MSGNLTSKSRLVRFGAAFLLAVCLGSLGATSALANDTRAPTAVSCHIGKIQVAGPTTWQYGTHHLVNDDGSLIRVFKELNPGVDLDKYTGFPRVVACSSPMEKPPVPGPNLYYVYFISAV